MKSKKKGLFSIRLNHFHISILILNMSNAFIANIYLSYFDEADEIIIYKPDRIYGSGHGVHLTTRMKMLVSKLNYSLFVHCRRISVERTRKK